MTTTVQLAMQQAWNSLGAEENGTTTPALVAEMARLGHRGFILNLTQHTASGDQIEAGVIDAPAEDQPALKKLLNFEELPSFEEIRAAARALATLATLAQAGGYKFAMVGGAPFLMAPLEEALRQAGVAPLYAFSRRESAEEVMPDGSVRKVAVFRHRGFV